MESGIHRFLCSTCHHQFHFANLILKVEYPPPYKCIFWGYSRADKTSTNQLINVIDWERLFRNITVDSQVSELNDPLLNIYSSYIPNKPVLCDDEHPPWMASRIRTPFEIKTMLTNNILLQK